MKELKLFLKFSNSSYGSFVDLHSGRNFGLKQEVTFFLVRSGRKLQNGRVVLLRLILTVLHEDIKQI